MTFNVIVSSEIVATVDQTDVATVCKAKRLRPVVTRTDDSGEPLEIEIRNADGRVDCLLKR